MKVIRGSIYEQIDQAEKFVLLNIKKSAWIEPGKLERQEMWEYPPDAIREAITNAIAHKDYNLSANVHVSIFDDRIEIWNPGKLSQLLTPEDLKREHKSIPTNPALANLLFLAKYIERWGTGTNDIVRWCVESGLPEPIFKEDTGGFAVILRKFKISSELESIELNERQRKAIGYLKEHRKITSREYQSLCSGINRETLRKDLNDLINKKVIIRKGAKKGVYYNMPTLCQLYANETSNFYLDFHNCFICISSAFELTSRLPHHLPYQNPMNIKPTAGVRMSSNGGSPLFSSS